MLRAKKRASKNDGRKRRKTAASAAAVVEVSVGGATSQQQGHQQQTKTSCYNSSAQMRAAKVIGSAWKKCFVSQTTLRLIGKFKDAKLMSTDIQDMR